MFLFHSVQPWGKPSSPLSVFTLPPLASTPNEPGPEVVFLSRHGLDHSITPSEVNARANIAALKSVGVEAIVAFSAVGSLREEIAPGTLPLPSFVRGENMWTDGGVAG